MTALPTRTDRMPRASVPRSSAKAVIAIALTSCDEKWAGRLLAEDSRPVHAVLDALDRAGLEIVEKKVK